MANEIENVIKSIKSAVDGIIVQFSGNNGNTNRNIEKTAYNKMHSTGIKFSSMGPSNVRLSPVVYESNPVVNGIKFSSD